MPENTKTDVKEKDCGCKASKEKHSTIEDYVARKMKSLKKQRKQK